MEEESDGGTKLPSHSPEESKSDQFALSPVTPPQGLSTPGDITTTVTDNPVLTQDSSPVLDNARLSSSTPDKQEATAAQTLQVSAEVHVVPGSYQDVADASEGPVGALSHMSLGTQVSSELSHQRDPSQSPSQSTAGDTVPCLSLNRAKPVAKLVGQMCAQLSPTQGLVPGGMRVPPLSNNAVIMLGQWINQVGLENLPLVQPKQVTCAAVRELFQVLRGVKIHLVQSEDDDSATSDTDAFHSSLHPEHSKMDPLVPNRRNPVDLEEGEISDHSSSPDAMDQDDILGHGTYLDRGLASDTGAAPGRISDFQSEEMDTTAQPSEVESYSDWPMESQDVRYTRNGPDSNWGKGESETAKRRRMYPKIQPYVIPIPSGIDNGRYREEDLMDPREVASPAHRVGWPNVDGSIGGDKGSPLPTKRPGRQYFHNNQELSQRVTYPCAEKDENGRYPHITEQECLAHAQHQDTACRGDAYWKDQLAHSHYLPTPEHSPVNFSHQVGRYTYVVPYHVVGPMAWEYPYHSGQPQEDLSDRLVPASLYGLKVARPGYCLADNKPATATQTRAAFDSGKGFRDHISDTDVNAHTTPAGHVGQGHLGTALFVCPQPECTVAGGHTFLFATIEQWAVHWNTMWPWLWCSTAWCKVVRLKQPLHQTH